jgi:hypothetical protein
MGRSSPRRNVYTHLTAAIVVPGCIALCWWQVSRALSGNTLSWAYVFEWPIFGAYGVFMWWKLIHDQPAATRTEQDGHAPSADAVTSTNDGQRDDDGDQGVDDAGEPPMAKEDKEDEELASYNRYLAALHASGKRKQW